MSSAEHVITCLRRQYRSLWPRMSMECMAWHVYRIPGTDQFSIFRDDARFDVPLERAVSNIHNMTEAQMVLKVMQILRG